MELNIEQIVQELDRVHIDIEPLDPCVWRQIYENNAKGIGTSFIDNPGVPCASCDGYGPQKNCYVKTPS